MSEIVLLILSFVVSLVINPVECGKTKSSFYMVHQNVKVDDSNVYTKVMTLSVRACAAECTQSDSCVTASFGMTSQLCYLANFDTTQAHNTANRCVTIAGFQTVSKIKYPVIQLYGSKGDNTIDSLEAASARCTEEGLRLASPEDLLQARDMGFELCDCSWLIDGNKGFVLQTPKLTCITIFTDGIIKCNNRKTANVWCKI